MEPFGHDDPIWLSYLATIVTWGKTAAVCVIADTVKTTGHNVEDKDA